VKIGTSIEDLFWAQNFKAQRNKNVYNLFCGFPQIELRES